MHSTSFLAFTLAMCGVVLAVPPPAPSRILAPLPTPAVDFGADNTPDCASIEEYCKCQGGDFNCETDPSCEWCRDHGAWGKPPAVSV